MRLGPKGARLALGVLFFLSGVAALGIETTWLRWFRTLFGATAPAASATLVAFFAGHALGSAFAARWLPRARRPLRAYGLLELAAAGAALLVPILLALGSGVAVSVYPSLAESPLVLAAQRFALAIVATLPAAACYGATLPVLAAALIRDASGLGTTGVAFYAANTAGAAIGAGLATFVLPEILGVRGSYGAAAALSLFAGTCALILAGRSGEDVAAVIPPAVAPIASPAPRATSRKRKAPPAQPPMTAAPANAQHLPFVGAALSGFVAFAVQVLLVQSFAQVLNGSIYAFGAVLVTVLIALALGAAVVATIETHTRAEPRALLAFALAVAGLTLAGFPQLLYLQTLGLRYVGAATPGAGYLGAALATTFVAAGPALLALAVLFPLCLALTARNLGAAADEATPLRVGRAVGRLAAVNTAGAIAGALAAPYLLLPAFGLWPSFAALGVLLAIASLAVRPADRSLALARDLLLGVGWIAVISSASPLGVPAVRVEDGERLLWSDTSPAGVVAVIDVKGERLIRTDNYSVLGGTAETVHQRRQGHLPLLLHPQARRVAYVGSATGISAGAALGHPIESLRLVEIVPGVAEAAQHFFHDANRSVYEDPRTKVSLDDARNFLRATDERYDLVVADLFVPWRAGTGSLYTREHFEAVREHLRDDGVFCQWLPLYQLSEEELRVIMATFLDVFPKSALFRGDFYGGYPIVALVGWKGAVAPAAAVSEAASALAAAGETDRWVTDPIGVWSLYVAPLAPFASELASVPRNDDDHPRIDFLSAQGHAGGTRGKQSPAVGVGFARLASRMAAAAAEVGDDVYPQLPEPARRAVAGGAALQSAGAFYVERRSEDAARALEAATSLLPPRLVGEADADPTAAEVWRSDR